MADLDTIAAGSRIRARGKFFFSGDEKVFLRGVTYGPFAPSAEGEPFPEKAIVEEDFGLMIELGANCLRTFTVPPAWLLDLAAAGGLRVLIGLPWAQHVCFLDSPTLARQIRRTIADGVATSRGHPAVFGYLVGNEIPPDVVRWHGGARIAAFLDDLVATAKERDPGALVSYANFPSTEYLDVASADFLAFNVYLHREAEFRRYLAHLHTLAGERPLVLTEFGVDSIRQGAREQAKMLSWMVKASFEQGAAGTVVFAWTDDWYALPLSGDGGFRVEDWHFGLVDARRRRKPAFQSVQQRYTAPLPPPLAEAPKVSVVVCAYNAEPTIDACLASLARLRYPDYEVIVVNDGSTDRTREIAERYDGIRLVNQRNRGLGAARNVGIEAATGDVVAFTDSDCVADPDWLTYLVETLQATGAAAVGGPNLPPPDESFVASCVAAAPGGPAHVLLDDQRAEHVPGCNIAFRRDVLLEVKGFDPIFRAAGDDVDVCWRLDDRGYTIAFSPAAVVWHFRRNTVHAYLGQQRGYGTGEALLTVKHPARFNELGHSRWRGRIYGGLGASILAQPRIYSGVFGRGLFQTLYQPPASLLSYLPVTLEWNVAAVLLFLAGALAGGQGWLGGLPLLVSWLWCAAHARRARLEPHVAGARARALVALLIYLGPLARSLARYRGHARLLQRAEPLSTPLGHALPGVGPRGFVVSYWNEVGLEKESLLEAAAAALTVRNYVVERDEGWSAWDLDVRGGLWSRARLTACTENHTGAKRLLRVRGGVRPTSLSILALGGYTALGAVATGLGWPGVAAVVAGVAILHGAVAFYESCTLARTLREALDRAHHRAVARARAAAAEVAA